MIDPTSSRISTRACTLMMVAAGAAFAPAAAAQVVYEDRAVIAGDGDADDSFGQDVAIDDGLVVSGALWTDKGATNAGSAYVHDAFTGVEIARLRASDYQAYATFGSSVAIDGDIVAVGAMNMDGFWAKSGAAYLFEASTETQLFKLTPGTEVPSGQFGNAIDIEGDVVVVGAHYYGVSGNTPGHAYLFDATTGLQTYQLIASDAAANDQFGYDVALDKDYVVVGAPRDDDNGNNSGSVYVFDPDTGTQLRKIIASDGAAQDRFGWSVAIHDGVIAVSAYLDDDNGTNSGSVYLYDASTGTELDKITLPGGAADDWFGFDVSLDAERLLASSGKSGAHTFDLATGDLIDSLTGTDTVAGDGYGFANAIWEGIAVVGAHDNNNTNGTDAGATYIYDVSCPADLDHDGDTDSDDVLLFLRDYMNGDPDADWNGDGVLDYFDVSAFNADVSAGCPH